MLPFIPAYGAFGVPARFVRANITALSGGSSPTVTVLIGSA